MYIPGGFLQQQKLEVHRALITACTKKHLTAIKFWVGVKIPRMRRQAIE